MNFLRRPEIIMSSLMLSGFMLFAWVDENTGFTFAHHIREIRVSGWLGFGLIMLTLAITPAARVHGHFRGKSWPANRLASTRRSLGLTATVITSVHLGLALQHYLPQNVDLLWENAWTKAGLTAWMLLLLLSATSYPIVIKRLRIRRWKSLHRLTYVVAGLMFQHVILAPWAPRKVILGLALLLTLLLTLRFVPKPRSRRLEKMHPDDVPNEATLEA